MLLRVTIVLKNGDSKFWWQFQQIYCPVHLFCSLFFPLCYSHLTFSLHTLSATYVKFIASPESEFTKQSDCRRSTGRGRFHFRSRIISFVLRCGQLTIVSSFFWYKNHRSPTPSPTTIYYYTNNNIIIVIIIIVITFLISSPYFVFAFLRGLRRWMRVCPCVRVPVWM